ncbi:MAG: CBS domain-containing protein [Gemmatimonadota bacterium]
MKLADLLAPDRIRLDLQPADLVGAVLEGLSQLSGLAKDLPELAARVVEGAAGAAVRVNEQVILVAAVDAVRNPEAALVVGREPFAAPIPVDDAVARAVLLLFVPGSLKTLKVQWFPALSRAIREGDTTARLLSARSPEAVLAIEPLMSTPLRRQLLVEDVMAPLSYRVYPETPMAEVVDLIVRRSVPAVPVVGEAHELLGMITAGDALAEMLPDRLGGEDDETPERKARTARDVMTRTVMCVGEGQQLLEAAHLMVKRGVEQLPVVREGQLVGFVGRDALLKTLSEL